MACSNIIIELERFITTLYTCESAVYLDASPTKKQTLKKYLLSAIVPISTICKALGFNDSEQIQDDEPVEEVCQLILENIRLKIEFLKGRTKNTYVIDLLCSIVVKKINPKLKKEICFCVWFPLHFGSRHLICKCTCKHVSMLINLIKSYHFLFFNKSQMVKYIQ